MTAGFSTARRLALWIALFLAIAISGAIGLAVAAPQILEDEAVG